MSKNKRYTYTLYYQVAGENEILQSRLYEYSIDGVIEKLRKVIGPFRLLKIYEEESDCE